MTPAVELAIETSGASLSAREYGCGGPRVILVHGGPGLVGYMTSLGKMLESRCRVVEYDQRGAPKSPSKGPFLVTDHVDDLADLVAHYSIGNEKPILLGHSWGAKLVMAYAARHPGKAGRLLLVSSGALNKEGGDVFISDLTRRLGKDGVARSDELEAAVSAASSPEEKRKAYARVLDLYMPLYHHDPKGSMEFGPVDVASLDATEADLDKKSEEGWFIKELDAITDPAVAYHGRQDPIPHDHVLPVIAAHLKGCVTHSYDDCGHFPWVEKEAGPKLVAQLLADIEA